MKCYQKFYFGFLLSTPLLASDQFEEETLKVASFNITADFYDKAEFPNHSWSQRKEHVLKTIKKVSPDIIGLQELSPTQASEVSELKGYCSLFLSQTPSEVEVGKIVDKSEIQLWIGKRIETPLVGILYEDESFSLVDKGRFWLKEDPHSLPIYTGRAATDKGFGNMNNYRATLWGEFKDLKTNKSIYFFNSHYPLSGTSSTRLNCAKIEHQMIDEITKNNFWVSVGDRNIVPKHHKIKYECTQIEDIKAITPLLENNFNAVDRSHHSGPMTTWAGFEYDHYKNPIVNGKFHYETVLDVMVSNRPAVRSQHIVTQFDTAGNMEINPDELHDQRNFASDHLMSVADYKI